jgi:hypothetical protein
MKIRDIITESGGTDPIKPEHKAAIRNAVTFPGQNMSTGSAYMNYRFGIALAGAPDYPTKADNYIAGDPLLAPYTKDEMDMINAAAQQVGDGSKQTWSDSRSREINNVQKVSPVASKKKNKYGV